MEEYEVIVSREVANEEGVAMRRFRLGLAAGVSDRKERSVALVIGCFGRQGKRS